MWEAFHGVLRPSALIAALGGMCLPGCIDAGVFPCQRDAQCQWNGQPGLCLDPPGYCAVVDPECGSGYRYHDRSGSEVAGQCADVVTPGTTTDTDTTTTVATTAMTSTGVTSEVSSTTDALTTSDGSTGTVECEGQACACAASVATGNAYTCVARTDGAVVCWGENGAGQLGTGEAGPPVPYLRYPEFPAGVLIEEVWAGNNHTCGRSNMADLYCWGNNGSGETDPMAEVIDPMPPMAPVHVSFVQTVATLGIAPAHTCAAGPGGLQTQCWGANGYGELMSEDVPPGPYVGTELGSGGIEELAAGRDHTCALIDGTVLCWARNNLGQLGNPADAGPTIVPQTVLLDRPPVTMAAGRDHTCAVVSDGTLRCWGSNAVNQIGDGTIVNATTPVTPAGPPGKVVALTARLDNTCALTEDGEVYCWGDINGTDLGTEIPNGDPLSVPTRVPVTEELPEPIVELDAGRFHVCARSASNRLWCWGSDASEQLGPVDPPDLKRAVEINLECPT